MVFVLVVQRALRATNGMSAREMPRSESSRFDSELSSEIVRRYARQSLNLPTMFIFIFLVVTPGCARTIDLKGLFLSTIQI